MGGMKGVNGCGHRRTVGIPGTARRRSWGNGRRAADGAAPRGRMPEGGRAERRERAEPEDEKKARWSLAAVERKGMRSKPPRCPQDDGRPRGAEGRWVRRQETEMDLTETYMKRLASCTSHVGKKWGSVCAALAGRNPPRASGCRGVPPLDGHRGRSAEGGRNDRENEPPYLRSTPRYNGSRVSGRCGGPSLDGHRGRSAEGGRNDKAGAPSVCKPGAGASGAAAAVGKRRRERDAELQIQAPRLTVRR